MSTFRDQMRTLAEELANQRQERKRFVAQNRRSALQLKSRVLRQREATIEENRSKAQQLHFELEQHNSLNQRRVSQTLAELRLRRRYRAADQASDLRHLVRTIRFEVSRALSHYASDRRHRRTVQLRDAKMSMRNIRERVKEIRKASRRLTRGVASDLLAVRQALATFRSQIRRTGGLYPVMRSQTQVSVKGRFTNGPEAPVVHASEHLGAVRVGPQLQQAVQPNVSENTIALGAASRVRTLGSFETSQFWLRPGTESSESTIGT